MKKTLMNEIKLWWHDLTHFHRRMSFRQGFRNHICCGDCSYGEDEIMKMAKKEWCV